MLEIGKIEKKISGLGFVVLPALVRRKLAGRGAIFVGTWDAVSSEQWVSCLCDARLRIEVIIGFANG